MCRYKLAINWQNFTKIILSPSKNIAKSSRGMLLFFDPHYTQLFIYLLPTLFEPVTSGKLGDGCLDGYAAVRGRQNSSVTWDREARTNKKNG